MQRTINPEKQLVITGPLIHRKLVIYGVCEKKGVGLLGNTKGERKPLPFVEDTAVPPENLSDYIREFRTLLESYGLEYAMFGPCGCWVLHVRPALDLKNPEEESWIRDLSDKVVELVKKYDGVMWGEHGTRFPQ